VSVEVSPVPVRTPKTAEVVAQTLRRQIVTGELKDGDFLPNEPELMAHFGVSRPTLREAIRVLESERLVEVRRGSRTGPRVCVPGPEVVARPAGLLLELSGATVADVMVTRIAIEPLAARLLAERGDTAAYDELEKMLEEEIPAAWEAGNLAEVSARFHRRLVELSGNAALSIIAGMVHELTERHTAAAIKRKRTVTQADYDMLRRSNRRLINLLRAGDGDKAEAHWRRHMERTRELVPRSLETTKVRDIT
jgi:GntR family transcriptional repressor for pyruvate dehydrogenase complex